MRYSQWQTKKNIVKVGVFDEKTTRKTPLYTIYTYLGSCFEWLPNSLIAGMFCNSLTISGQSHFPDWPIWISSHFPIERFGNNTYVRKSNVWKLWANYGQIMIMIVVHNCPWFSLQIKAPFGKGTCSTTLSSGSSGTWNSALRPFNGTHWGNSAARRPRSSSSQSAAVRVQTGTPISRVTYSYCGMAETFHHWLCMGQSELCFSELDGCNNHCNVFYHMRANHTFRSISTIWKWRCAAVKLVMETPWGKKQPW